MMKQSGLLAFYVMTDLQQWGPTIVIQSIGFPTRRPWLAWWARCIQVDSRELPHTDQRLFAILQHSLDSVVPLQGRARSEVVF